jgi:hypothetical protein
MKFNESGHISRNPSFLQEEIWRMGPEGRDGRVYKVSAGTGQSMVTRRQY